jgi:hypothetical protein
MPPGSIKDAEGRSSNVVGNLNLNGKSMVVMNSYIVPSEAWNRVISLPMTFSCVYFVEAIANGAPDLCGAKIFSERLSDIETLETAMGSSVLERISTVPTNLGLDIEC